MKHRMLHGWVVAIVCLLSLPMAAHAFPDVFVQEGLVTDEDGRPYIGDYDITVRLYTEVRGGNAVFEETHEAVPFVEGYYAIAVGSRSDTLAQVILSGENTELYLAITVDGGDELTPRIALTKVPATFMADLATTLVPTTDLNINSVSISGNTVIDANGRWVGESTGLRGPKGDKGDQGEQGIQGVKGDKGDKGDAGDEGQQGSPDTPQQVRDKLLQADGTGSNIDADLIDGISSGSF
ncbi:MAG: collagen-like protein, partial [Myxococcota bacterium]|nr:collagen-like protein [Myxococcota bacterium]